MGLDRGVSYYSLRSHQVSILPQLQAYSSLPVIGRIHAMGATCPCLHPCSWKTYLTLRRTANR